MARVTAARGRAGTSLTRWAPLNQHLSLALQNVSSGRYSLSSLMTGIPEACHLKDLDVLLAA
jgi:hypothetical protein